MNYVILTCTLIMVLTGCTFSVNLMHNEGSGVDEVEEATDVAPQLKR